MRDALGLIMISNGALFLFGAEQRAGFSLGRLHEPRIVPASIVETIFALLLLWGSVAIFRHFPRHWRIALIANRVAYGSGSSRVA